MLENQYYDHPLGTKILEAEIVYVIFGLLFHHLK